MTTRPTAWARGHDGGRSVLQLAEQEPPATRYQDETDYRVPDLAVYSPDRASERGIERRCELVIEIRSPGDETDSKVPWYIGQGVTEVLMIDRDNLAVELFTGVDSAPIAVRPAHSNVLDCTVERVDDDTLRITHASSTDDVTTH